MTSAGRRVCPCTSSRRARGLRKTGESSVSPGITSFHRRANPGCLFSRVGTVATDTLGHDACLRHAGFLTKICMRGQEPRGWLRTADAGHHNPEIYSIHNERETAAVGVEAADASAARRLALQKRHIFFITRRNAPGTGAGYTRPHPVCRHPAWPRPARPSRRGGRRLRCRPGAHCR